MNSMTTEPPALFAQRASLKGKHTEDGDMEAKIIADITLRYIPGIWYYMALLNWEHGAIALVIIQAPTIVAGPL